MDSHGFRHFLLETPDFFLPNKIHGFFLDSGISGARYSVERSWQTQHLPTTADGVDMTWRHGGCGGGGGGGGGTPYLDVPGI